MQKRLVLLQNDARKSQHLELATCRQFRVEVQLQHGKRNHRDQSCLDLLLRSVWAVAGKCIELCVCTPFQFCLTLQCTPASFHTSAFLVPYGRHTGLAVASILMSHYLTALHRYIPTVKMYSLIGSAFHDPWDGKWVSDFGLSNNNKWRWWVWMVTAHRRSYTAQVIWLSLRVGGHLELSLHSSNEPRANSRNGYAMMTAP